MNGGVSSPEKKSARVGLQVGRGLRDVVTL